MTTRAQHSAIPLKSSRSWITAQSPQSAIHDAPPTNGSDVEPSSPARSVEGGAVLQVLEQINREVGQFAKVSAVQHALMASQSQKTWGALHTVLASRMTVTKGRRGTDTGKP